MAWVAAEGWLRTTGNQLSLHCNFFNQFLCENQISPLKIFKAAEETMGKKQNMVLFGYIPSVKVRWNLMIHTCVFLNWYPLNMIHCKMTRADEFQVDLNDSAK